ncbi:MAG: hypothetical protein PWQ35_94 [Patescibacteria group bacterium]|nr:hypothetical protein [Patescibacteria group bacterium]
MKKNKEFPVFSQRDKSWSLYELRKRNKKFVSMTILYLSNPDQSQGKRKSFWDYFSCPCCHQEIKEVVVNDENGILLSFDKKNKAVIRFRDENAWKAVENYDERTMKKEEDSHLFYPYCFTFPVMNIKRIVWV